MWLHFKYPMQKKDFYKNTHVIFIFSLMNLRILAFNIPVFLTIKSFLLVSMSRLAWNCFFFERQRIRRHAVWLSDDLPTRFFLVKIFKPRTLIMLLSLTSISKIRPQSIFIKIQNIVFNFTECVTDEFNAKLDWLAFRMATPSCLAFEHHIQSQIVCSGLGLFHFVTKHLC